MSSYFTLHERLKNIHSKQIFYEKSSHFVWFIYQFCLKMVKRFRKLILKQVLILDASFFLFFLTCYVLSKVKCTNNFLLNQLEIKRIFVKYWNENTFFSKMNTTTTHMIELEVQHRNFQSPMSFRESFKIRAVFHF